MSHIENRYWHREDNLWTHDGDNQTLGQSGCNTTTGCNYRATGMFVFYFHCPCFCYPDSSCSSVNCAMMDTVYTK